MCTLVHFPKCKDIVARRVDFGISTWNKRVESCAHSASFALLCTSAKQKVHHGDVPARDYGSGHAVSDFTTWLQSHRGAGAYFSGHVKLFFWISQFFIFWLNCYPAPPGHGIYGIYLVYSMATPIRDRYRDQNYPESLKFVYTKYILYVVILQAYAIYIWNIPGIYHFSMVYTRYI